MKSNDDRVVVGGSGLDWRVLGQSVYRVYEMCCERSDHLPDRARGHPRARRLRRVHRCADQWWCQADDPAPRVVIRLHFHSATSTSSSLLVLKMTEFVVIERAYSRTVLYWIPSHSVCFVWYFVTDFSFITFFLYYLYSLSFVWNSSYLSLVVNDRTVGGPQYGVVFTGIVRVRWHLFCTQIEAAPVLIKRGIFVGFYN